MSASGGEPAALAAFQPEPFGAVRSVLLHCLSRRDDDLGLDDYAS
jgi:hypothetical protein